MGEQIIFNVSESTTDGTYNVTIWVPNPTDSNPKSPTSWVSKGPVPRTVPTGKQAAPGFFFDETSDLLLMSLWSFKGQAGGDATPFYAARISSHLGLIDSVELPVKDTFGAVYIGGLVVTSSNGCDIIKNVTPDYMQRSVDNSYWIRQPNGSAWYEITITPSTTPGSKKGPLAAVNGQLICPTAMFPNFNYVHYLSLRSLHEVTFRYFWLDSFQPQYLPTSSGGNAYCTRTQVLLPENANPNFWDSDFYPMGSLVTSNNNSNTYLLYMFWACDLTSGIGYYYVQLESDGSLNTSTDTIQAQGYATVPGTSKMDANWFNVVQAMGRVFCFWSSGSKCLGLSSSIASDGTIKGDWTWVQGPTTGPATKGVFSCVSVPKPWYTMPSGL
ncbi:Ff.00g084670.m01.CDS01 [Fusarium sp. VM40]|nr:Ff.00g084670.m01.CDS01 [Fusarium sp. VM40]